MEDPRKTELKNYFPIFQVNSHPENSIFRLETISWLVIFHAVNNNRQSPGPSKSKSIHRERTFPMYQLKLILQSIFNSCLHLHIKFFGCEAEVMERVSLLLIRMHTMEICAWQITLFDGSRNALITRESPIILWYLCGCLFNEIRNDEYSGWRPLQLQFQKMDSKWIKFYRQYQFEIFNLQKPHPINYY